MTIRKQYSGRSYETFEDDQETVAQSPSSYQRVGDSDKSRSAAAEARRLGSAGSWADNFGSPATTRTPAASTVDGDEERDVRYPHLSQDDPSDPPPVYTPSVSTQPASQSPAAPASPVTARSVQAPEPVSAPSTISPPSDSSSQPLLQQIDEEDGSSPLPEAVQHHHGENHDEEADSDTLPVFLQQSRRESGSRSGFGPGPGHGPGHKRGGCHGRRKARTCGERRHGGWRHHIHDKRRSRKLKKICVFALMLIACLALLIPGLCKSFKNDNRYSFPHVGNAQWPPIEREHRENETHRSISGTYKLYDLLDLSTSSGSISVTIEVQPGEKPAVLRLSSSAGSVNIKMTERAGGLFKRDVISENARNRVINTEISTSAGSVSGNIVHGNGGTSTISSKAGSISVDVWTYNVSELDERSIITTVTNHGSQNIKVYADVANTEPIRAIDATHTVRGSGSVNVGYPKEWEGMVHITTHGYGSVAASGRGLIVNKESNHELYGYRGPKAGRKIEISELGSGSARFTC